MASRCTCSSVVATSICTSRSTPATPGPDTLVYFYVDDVDSIAAEFDVEVIDQPWAREIQLTDPDGNRLRIGTLHPTG